MNWRRALVVDDDRFSRRVLVRSLRLAGVEHAEETGSGSVAIRRIMQGGEDGIDLVLCDLQMPGMDGIELLRRLADLRFAGGVLLVSGAGRTVLQVTEELGRARGLSVLGILEKPVPFERLTELLRDHPQGLAQPAPTDPAGAPTLDELCDAIQAGQIQPVYQPKVDVATGRLRGVEALARWTRAGGTPVSPAVFVPMAESGGLIDALTDRLMAQVFAQLHDWSARSLVNHVAVNVAMSSLRDLEFPDRVMTRIMHAGVDPATVTLEVTESQLMDDAIACVDSLLRLRLRGIGLAIDDFGTRYASLAQLRALPFTELKVDGSFVHGAASDVRARAILESSVALGRALGMEVVAEGVETEADWRRIAALGCPVAQGYYIGRPMTAEVLERWVREQALQPASVLPAMNPPATALSRPLPER